MVFQKTALEKSVEKEKDIEKKILMMYELCLEFINYNEQGYKRYLKEAVALSVKHQFAYGINYSKAFRASDEREKGNYTKALNLFDVCVVAFRDNNNLVMLGFCLNGIGSCYYSMCNLEKAYYYYKEALEINKQLDNKMRLAVSYNNLNMVLDDMKAYDEEIKYSYESIELFENSTENYFYYLNTVRLIHVFNRLSRFDEAKREIKRIKKFKSLEGHEAVYSFYCIEKGRLEIIDANYKRAYRYIKKGIDIAAEQEDSDLQALGYYYLQFYYKEKGNKVKRINVLEKAYKHGEVGYYSLIVNKSMKKLIKLYKKDKRYDLALDVYERLYAYHVKEYINYSELKLKSLIIDTELLVLKEKNNELEILASTDSLTGVYNRRYLVNHIDELSNDEVFSVLLIDVDDFKRINDQCGHICGDEVLKRIVNAIKKGVGNNGIIGRYGGDEFTVIILENRQAMLEKMKYKILNEIAQVEIGDNYKVTISGGLIKNVTREILGEALIKADKLLYEVKVNTKNDIYIQ